MKFTTHSKYLKADAISDVNDTILTIKGATLEKVGQGNDAKDMCILYFRETDKGLGLNRTNGEILKDLFKTDEMDEWIGKQIALYVDKNVYYGGQKKPAIRIRPFIPGSGQKQPQAFDADEWLTELNLARTPIEVFALKRKLTYAPLTDQEATEFHEFADARMVELKPTT